MSDQVWTGETEAHERAFMSIGRLVYRWNLIERAFSMNVLMLNQSILEERRPRLVEPIGQKIELWEKMFPMSSLTDMQSVSDEYVQLLTDAKNDRNNLLHANWGLDPFETSFEEITLSFMSFKKNDVLIGDSRITIDTVDEYVRSLGALTQYNLRFSIVLTGLGSSNLANGGRPRSPT